MNYIIRFLMSKLCVDIYTVYLNVRIGKFQGLDRLFELKKECIP